MRALLLSLSITLAAAGTGWPDVFYEEVVVNSGMGSRKAGARKTVNRIYIKGERQRVHSEIEASKKVKKKLRKQGTPLEASTILQLDKANVFEIDHAKQTYLQQRLPPVKRRGAIETGIPMPEATGKRVAALKPTDKSREVSFRTKVMPDTSRIEGILCRRVAAELKARHFKPGTKNVRRENRYLYQAWMATDFPGSGEIEGFLERHKKRTSYPSPIGGGLDQLASSVDDYDRLEKELSALKGFPMQSELKVFTKAAGGKEKRLLKLSRKVNSLTYSPLPDSLFELSKGLRRAAK